MSGKMFLELGKYVPKRHIFDIMNYFKEHKVSFNHNTYKVCRKLKLNLKAQEIKQCCSGIGGGKDDRYEKIGDDSKKIKINLQNKDFEAKIYEYNDGYLKTINFVKIHGVYNNGNENFNEDEFCGIIIISKDDENNNIATIQSINNYNDCIKCFNNLKFKIGDILMKIIICVCAHKDVKKFQLTDNSYLECGMDKIPLIFLRTITHGKPYYSKYGFMPINHNKKNKNNYYDNELLIYNNNYANYKKNPTIKKSDLIQILNYKKFDPKKDEKMINYINNVLIPSLDGENIYIKDFVNKILESNNKISCELLFCIIQNIYFKSGYNEYKYKYFEYILSDKNIEAIKKKIKIRKL